MQPPLEYMFGPFENGVQYAGISLHEFLVEMHANWSTTSRDNLAGSHKGLINSPQSTTYKLLKEIVLDVHSQHLLNRLGSYVPALKGTGRNLSDGQIEGLRLALPLHSTYAYEGNMLRLPALRHNLTQWAAVTALYELLLQTDYWQVRGRTKIRHLYNLYSLGLLNDGHIDQLYVQTQLEAFYAELQAREASKFAFHPLDVMARLFNPSYFERLLELGLVALAPVNTARRAF